jgi:choline dehydrogenase
MASRESSYYYIIVGSGSAGGVLANRLSAGPDIRVLLLEAGRPDGSWTIRMPSAIPINFYGGRYNWQYETEPQVHLNNRRIYVPRGKTLGGSSSINGMMYVRGHALDYDRWVEEGSAGWSYAEVLPYFRRCENHATKAGEYHGSEGPLGVVTTSQDNPLYEAYMAAVEEAGYPHSDDYNGYQQEGAVRYDLNTSGGERASTGSAYIGPARHRPNLAVVTGALATRIAVEDHRATGVAYRQGNRQCNARADREVILCGGAVNSPQLLMLSGIGRADDLTALDIAPVHDLPGVGQNLHDHVETFVEHECTQPITLYKHMKPWNAALIGLNWLLFRRGVGVSSHFESGSFIRTRAGIKHPDIQHCFVLRLSRNPFKMGANRHGFRVHVGPMRPTSRGTITLASNDPGDAPRIDPNMLATENDRQVMRDGLKLTREIVGQRALAPFRGPEIGPGSGVTSDADLDAYIRGGAESAFHLCGSCKMGTDDLAVVDAECRVHGLESLRVVDASIIPSMVSGNLNAPTMMIGEKAADMILGKAPLEPSNALVYVAGN